jgi:hypothetical protein
MKLTYFIFSNKKRTQPMNQDSLHKNLLVSHLYHETDEGEAALINRLIADNWDIKEEFEALQNTKNILNKAQQSKPKRSSIELIMQYNNRTKELEPLI